MTRVTAMRILARVIPVRTRNWLLLHLARLPVYGYRIAPRTFPVEKWLLSTGTRDTSALITSLSAGKNSSIKFADLGPETLLARARVMALSANTEQQRKEALELYEVAMTRDGTSAITQLGLVPPILVSQSSLCPPRNRTWAL